MKALGLGIAAIILLGISGLLDQESGVGVWLELDRDLSRSEARVSLLVNQNEAMRREIEMLEAEPAAIDRAIREELDLALPGELVVRFSATDVRGKADVEVEVEADSGLSFLRRLFMDAGSDRETK